MHALTVSGVLSVWRTRADSVEARGVRSGMMVWRTDLEERCAAHQGMALKWAMGSEMGWLWDEVGVWGDILGDWDLSCCEIVCFDLGN